VCQNAYDRFCGFQFDEEDLALEVIAGVGPRGHFLREKHTRHRIRDFRLSCLLRQKGADGRQRDPREVARGIFKGIYESHQPQPLPGEVQAELARIVAVADREMEGKER
jgi:trimethylamine--corrinoid protein Co-methyltransferase